MRSNIDHDTVLQGLSISERTERALFDFRMGLYAGEKPIRGKKTPTHLYYVPHLLEWYPNVEVIHILRDPRAVYVSNKRKEEIIASRSPRGSIRQSRIALTFYITISWLQAVKLHFYYEKVFFENYNLIKFESLVSSPETCLNKISSFLEVGLIEKMLQPTNRNSSFTVYDPRPGFNTTTIERRREELHPISNKWFVFWTKKHLHEFGYTIN